MEAPWKARLASGEISGSLCPEWGRFHLTCPPHLAARTWAVMFLCIWQQTEEFFSRESKQSPEKRKAILILGGMLSKTLLRSSPYHLTVTSTNPTHIHRVSTQVASSRLFSRCRKVRVRNGQEASFMNVQDETTHTTKSTEVTKPIEGTREN